MCGTQLKDWGVRGGVSEGRFFFLVRHDQRSRTLISPAVRVNGANWPGEV